MAAQGVLPHATCLPIEDVSERRNIDAAGVLGPASFSRVSGVCFFLGLGVESAAARAVAVKQEAGVVDVAHVVVLIGWGRVIKSALSKGRFIPCRCHFLVNSVPLSPYCPTFVGPLGKMHVPQTPSSPGQDA